MGRGHRLTLSSSSSVKKVALLTDIFRSTLLITRLSLATGILFSREHADWNRVDVGKEDIWRLEAEGERRREGRRRGGGGARGDGGKG